MSYWLLNMSQYMDSPHVLYYCCLSVAMKNYITSSISYMMCGVSEPAVTMLLLLLLLLLLRTRPILVLCTRNVFMAVIFICNRNGSRQGNVHILMVVRFKCALKDLVVRG